MTPSANYIRACRLKNPLDTGRLKHILAMYPNAKFVYIHRHPIEVLHSTLKMWKVYVPSTALEAYDVKENLPYILHAFGEQTSTIVSSIASASATAIATVTDTDVAAASRC